jgi:hypothetical protein
MVLVRSGDGGGPDDPTEIVEQAVASASRDDCERLAELSVRPDDDRDAFVVHCEEQDGARALLAGMQVLGPRRSAREVPPSPVWG